MTARSRTVRASNFARTNVVQVTHGTETFELPVTAVAAPVV
jgi:hypothetical protein